MEGMMPIRSPSDVDVYVSAIANRTDIDTNVLTERLIEQLRGCNSTLIEYACRQAESLDLHDHGRDTSPRGQRIQLMTSKLQLLRHEHGKG